MYILTDSFLHSVEPTYDRFRKHIANAKLHSIKTYLEIDLEMT